MSNFIILGNFNFAVDTLFQSELSEFCSSYDLSMSDYDCYGQDSRQFIYLACLANRS